MDITQHERGMIAETDIPFIGNGYRAIPDIRAAGREPDSRIVERVQDANRGADAAYKMHIGIFQGKITDKPERILEFLTRQAQFIPVQNPVAAEIEAVHHHCPDPE